MSESVVEPDSNEEDLLDDFIAEAFRLLPEWEPSDALRERLQERVAIRTAPLRRMLIEERQGNHYRRISYEAERPSRATAATINRLRPGRTVVTHYYQIRENNR